MLDFYGERTVTLSNQITYSHDKKKVKFREYIDPVIGDMGHVPSLDEALN